MLRRWSLLAGALLVFVATGAAAQTPKTEDARSEDTRVQYPAFLANSYFSINVGSIGYLFSGQQLQPGFNLGTIESPRLAARIDLFGHRFTKFLSAQATYMRPVKYVTYRNLNGGTEGGQVSMAYGGITLVGDVPLGPRVSAYVEGGGGVTSRSGFVVKSVPAVQSAHYLAGLLGAGLVYHANPNVDVVFGATYSPGREAFNQPSTRLFTTGFRYWMRPLPESVVAEKRRTGYVFPANIIRLGYTSNVAEYGVNNFLSGTVPVFWGGNVETRQGVTLDYQRNVFHTKKRFAFDLGASASYWQSNKKEEAFRTVSIYPLFRFFLIRSEPGDIYFSYSLAGPTYINPIVVDGRDTGEHFTFQDFIGLGTYLGKGRHLNAEVGIKHYSNGNIFTTNASVKVPLTFTLGFAF